MTGSNRRPPACKAGALPAELIPRDPRQPDIGILVGLVGLEPTTPALSRRCSNRSEEHTSELQSQSNLVCRLLLEKKKKQTGKSITRNRTVRITATESWERQRKTEEGGSGRQT